MEILVLSSHLFRFVLAALAVYLCVVLFLRHRAWGWLLVSAIFLEPYVGAVTRFMRGKPILRYKGTAVTESGAQLVSYTLDFPVLYILAVAGLLMLVLRLPRRSGN